MGTQKISSHVTILLTPDMEPSQLFCVLETQNKITISVPQKEHIILYLFSGLTLKWSRGSPYGPNN